MTQIERVSTCKPSTLKPLKVSLALVTVVPHIYRSWSILSLKAIYCCTNGTVYSAHMTKHCHFLTYHKYCFRNI